MLNGCIGDLPLDDGNIPCEHVISILAYWSVVIESHTWLCISKCPGVSTIHDEGIFIRKILKAKKCFYLQLSHAIVSVNCMCIILQVHKSG
jgi:hypothetical protein